ncbi:DUF11 domain-containing protein, partial [Chitinophagales bacterium]|nr:DUF11 domain-containing protein [Chitinophagales bacterium]
DPSFVPGLIHAANNVSVLDNLPACVQYISDSPSQGYYNPATGEWLIGTIANGSSVSLDVEVQIICGGTIENVAQVNEADEEDIDSEPGNDDGDQSEDDEDNDVITVPVIDLELDKRVKGDVSEVNVGDQIAYEIELKNLGPDLATGVVVTEYLPTGVSFIGANTFGNGTYNSANHQWNVGDVPAGATYVLEILVTVDVSGMITNIAEVTDHEEDDIDSSPDNDDDDQSEDDEDAVTIGGIEADLELSKTSDATGPVNVGDQVVWTITVENNGPAVATNVEVTESLPDCLDFVSANPTNGTFNSTTGIWEIATLSIGEQEDLVIITTLNSIGSCVNSAEVTGSDQPDPDSDPDNDDPTEDDQDDDEVEGVQVDLELTKSNDAASPLFDGDQFTYTIEVCNVLNEDVGLIYDASGVAVMDVLPLGLTYLTSSASQGAYDVVSGIWTIGAIANDDCKTLDITVLVDGSVAGTIVNVAEVSNADQPDVDSTPDNDDGDQSEDDEDSTPVQVGDVVVDLELVKETIDLPVPTFIGDSFAYTISVTNVNDVATDLIHEATGVEVFDLLPSCVNYLTHSTTTGNYNPSTGIWTVGAMNSGETDVLTVYVQIDCAGLITNSAQVSDHDQEDIDSVPNNDDGDQSEDDEDAVDVTVTDVVVDLELEKSSNAGSPLYVGDSFTYTIAVQNVKDAANDLIHQATGVSILDNLPAGVVYQSHFSSTGFYNTTTGLWTIGTIANGEIQTLDITVQIVAEGTIVNTAQIAAQNEEDIDSEPGNDNGDQSEDDEDNEPITVDPIVI